PRVEQASQASEGTGESTFPKTVYQFPNTTWVENIRSMRNGSLLVGIIGQPELHMINPFAEPATASLTTTFPAPATAVFGITELVPDVFAVVTGNYSYVTGTVPGTYSIWKIDLSVKSNSSVSKIADVPETQLLNGMTTLDSETLLIADSSGKLYALDVQTGKAAVVLDDPTMKPVAGAPVSIGINGVKVVGDFLYYTNTFQNSINRALVHRGNTTSFGPIETIASNVTMPDDLDVADDGTVIVPQAWANTVSRVQLDGQVTRIAGNLNSSLVAGGTSATLGRTWKDRNVAYVSTTGGIGSPVNGSFVEGGKVVAIKIDC
ncbi:hypothetical protein EJ04DRAFT_595201, partial [Polyplosphaeria fusca]